MNVATQLIDRMIAAQNQAEATQPKSDRGGDSEFESLIRQKTAANSAGESADTNKAPADQTETVTVQDDGAQELRQELAAALITMQPAIPINLVQTEQSAVKSAEMPALYPVVEPTITDPAQTTANTGTWALPLDTISAAADAPRAIQTPATATTLEAQPVTGPVQDTVIETVSAADTGKTDTQTGEEHSSDTVSTLGYTVEKKDTDPAEKTEQPVFDSLEAVPVKVGEASLAGKQTAPVLQLEQPGATEELAKQLAEAAVSGTEKLEIKLSPEGLGEMTVEITRADDGSLGVVLKATTDKATGLLQQQSSALQSILAAGTQGVVKVEVQDASRQQSMEQFLNPDDSSGREDAQSRQEQQQQKERQQQTQDFIQQLRLGLVDISRPA